MENSHYKLISDPSAKVNKSVQRSAFKFVLHNDELYQRTAKDMLLKCLDAYQAKVAMGEVHEDICGMYQLARKMKWLLCGASFYWPSMIFDYFHYYKGCEGCQRFGNVQLVPIAMFHPIITLWLF